MWQSIRRHLLLATRYYSRISPPPPAYARPVIRVSNNVAQLGSRKEGSKPRQLLSLPPFPGYPLPRKNQIGFSGESTHVTAITWVKHYFDEIHDSVIQSHFRKGLVSKNTYSSFSQLVLSFCLFPAISIVLLAFCNFCNVENLRHIFEL